MKKGIISLLLLLAIGYYARAQSDSVNRNPVFERISKEMAAFRIDTSAVPNDKITQKINELRQLRGGFNINEAIAFMLGQDRQKGEMTTAQLDQLEAFFTIGNGRRWLDNATNHIYRKYFSYKELKQLVRFYRSDAGRKMASDFPLVVMQSLAVAEMLKNQFLQQSPH